jgi:hypothetical protein
VVQPAVPHELEGGRVLVRRFVLVVTAAAIVLVLGVGVALADPINSKKAITFTVSCGGETFEVVEPFGAGGAVHILGDTTNIVVKEITFTALDPETGEELDTVTFATGAMVGLQEDLVTCTREPFRVTDPELGEIDILAEARVLFTARGR